MRLPFHSPASPSPSWCSAPYYYPNGSALLVWGGQGGPKVGAGLWAGFSPDWRGPYAQVFAPPIDQKVKNVEDPAIFRDHRGNLHMLTNANSGHAHCKASGACGGHSWSRDGLSWSPIFVGAFGPVTKLNNGSTVDLGFVERPQIAQEEDGSAPLALFLGTGYTHRSYTWAQKFCDADSMAKDACGYMGGIDPRGMQSTRLKSDETVLANPAGALEGSWVGTQTCHSSLSQKCLPEPELNQQLTLTANGSGTFQAALRLRSSQVSSGPQGNAFATGEVLGRSGEVHGTYMLQASATELIGSWTSWTGSERLFLWSMKRGHAQPAPKSCACGRNATDGCVPCKPPPPVKLSPLYDSLYNQSFAHLFLLAAFR